MRPFHPAVPFLLVLLGLASSAGAFEGTLKWRLVQVDKKAITAVAGDDKADKIFAVPMERLMSMHGEARVTDATIQVKGSKVRADTTLRDGKGYTITDLDTGITLVVMTAEKKVMEIGKTDIDAMQQRNAALQGMLMKQAENAPAEQQQGVKALIDRARGEDERLDLEVVDLDRSQSINGFNARAFEVRGAKAAVVGWVTKEHPEVVELVRRFDKSRSQMGQRTAAARPKELLAERGLPVRVQTLDERQYLLEDLVEVRSMPLADDVFTVPPGFEKSSARMMMERAGRAPAGP